jgi:DHA1 family inner membrane transport protein
VFWYLLIANSLQVMAYVGMSGYLAAYLIQTYGLATGDTALPLTLAGLGVIAGSVVGGRVADRTDRVIVLAYTFLGGGLMAALVFTLALSPWLTVLCACVGGGLLLLSWPVTAVLITTLAGPSRATATGLLAVSNQLGGSVGPRWVD